MDENNETFWILFFMFLLALGWVVFAVKGKINENMVAWANHRNGTGKPRNPINGNLQTRPNQSPSNGRHSNISNPVREKRHSHTYADVGEEGKEVLSGNQPLVPPPGPS
jgi:hypothetical protein